MKWTVNEKKKIYMHTQANSHFNTTISITQKQTNKHKYTYIYISTRRLFKFLKINCTHSNNGLVYQFNRVVWYTQCVACNIFAEMLLHFRTHEAILRSFFNRIYIYMLYVSLPVMGCVTESFSLRLCSVLFCFFFLRASTICIIWTTTATGKERLTGYRMLNAIW